MEITIKAPVWEGSEFVDPRFAAGYPYAEMDPDTKQINFVIKLKDGAASEANPVEVFMVATDSNAHSETNVEAVKHGHFGVNAPVWTSEYPYLRVTDNNEYVIETDLILTGRWDIAAYFVLVDNTSTSEQPTKLYFDGETVSALDTYPPDQVEAYINDARDKIVMYYDEELDKNSVPDKTAFGISGVEGATVVGVTVTNFDNDNQGKVILSISGIGTDVDISELRVTYTPPEHNKLQDTADEPNYCLPIPQDNYYHNTGIIKEADVSLERDKIHISDDGKYIYIETTGAGYWYDEWYLFDISVEYGAQELDYFISTSIYSMYGYHHTYYLQLREGEELVIDPEKSFTITLTPIVGVVDFAGDPLTTLTINGLKPAETPISFKKAEYDSDGLKVFFDGEFGEWYNTPACSFKLKVNGENYILRGWAIYEDWHEEPYFMFYEENIPVTIQPGDELLLTYKLEHEDMRAFDIITELSGKPMDEFYDKPVENKLPTEP